MSLDPLPPPPRTQIKAVLRSTRSRHGGAVTPRGVVRLIRTYLLRLMRRGELRHVVEGRIPVLTTREVRVEVAPIANDPTPVTASVRARNGYGNTHNVEWLEVKVNGNIRYIPLYD